MNLNKLPSWNYYHGRQEQARCAMEAETGLKNCSSIWAINQNKIGEKNAPMKCEKLFCLNLILFNLKSCKFKIISSPHFECVHYCTIVSGPRQWGKVKEAKKIWSPVWLSATGRQGVSSWTTFAPPSWNVVASLKFFQKQNKEQ